MKSVFGSQGIRQYGGGIGPISKANRAHTVHLLVLSVIIIGMGIIVFFMLSSFNLIPQPRYDENWCKKLLSQHDPEVLKMAFNVNYTALSIVKTNYSFTITGDSFIGKAVTITTTNGTAIDCSIEAISTTGMDLLNPTAYSCTNDTSYRLVSETTDDHLYSGKEIAVSLSSPMMRERFAALNLSTNLTGFVYVDYIIYRTPDNLNNHNMDVASSDEVVKAYCTPVIME